MNKKTLILMIVFVLLAVVISSIVFLDVQITDENTEIESENIGEKEVDPKDKELFDDIISGDLSNLPLEDYDTTSDYRECSLIINFLSETSINKLETEIPSNNLELTNELSSFHKRIFPNEELIKQEFEEAKVKKLILTQLRPIYSELVESNEIQIIRKTLIWDYITKSIWTRDLMEVDYNPTILSYCIVDSDDSDLRQFKEEDGFISILEVN